MTDRGYTRIRSEDVFQRDVLQILGTRRRATKGLTQKINEAFLSDSMAQKEL